MAGEDHAVKSHARILRDHLESIAAAILLALVIRQFVCEAFKIPTGSMAPTLLGVHKEVLCPNCRIPFTVGQSDSARTSGVVECPNCHHVWPGASPLCGPSDPVRMRRPSWLWNEGRCGASGRVLRGSEGADRVDRGGSRIVVSKFTYHLPWREPRRWEVVVFLFPMLKNTCAKCGWSWETTEVPDACPECGSRRIHTERRNFIKRLVGLPGERIQVMDGDAWINGAVAARPVEIQKTVWLPVFDSLYWPDRLPEWAWPEGRVFLGDSRYVSGKAGQWTVDARQAGADPVLATFGRTVTDHYGYDAASVQADRRIGGTSGFHRVDDLSLTVDAVPQSAGALVLALQGRDGRFVAELAAGEGQGGGTLTWFDGQRLTTRQIAGAPLRLGYRCEAALWVADRVCRVLVGGRVAAELAMGQAAPSGGAPDGRPDQVVGFGARGALCRFDRIRIARDIYYTRGEGNFDAPYQIRPDHYVFLGDNSPDSNDSRSWRLPDVPRRYLAGRAFYAFWPLQESRHLPTTAEP